MNVKKKGEKSMKTKAEFWEETSSEGNIIAFSNLSMFVFGVLDMELENQLNAKALAVCCPQHCVCSGHCCCNLSSPFHSLLMVPCVEHSKAPSAHGRLCMCSHLLSALLFSGSLSRFLPFAVAWQLFHWGGTSDSHLSALTVCYNCVAMS